MTRKALVRTPTGRGRAVTVNPGNRPRHGVLGVARWLHEDRVWAGEEVRLEHLLAFARDVRKLAATSPNPNPAVGRANDRRAPVDQHEVPASRRNEVFAAPAEHDRV